jgi:hypothetical protein
MFTLITQVWDSRAGAYVEDELSLWDALPSFQREALLRLAEAFPGSEWVQLAREAYDGSEAA